MPRHTYEIVISWNVLDSLFVATVPELAGCMAHGETDAEALHNIHDAIQLWLNTAEEFGDVIPHPHHMNSFQEQ